MRGLTRSGSLVSWFLNVADQNRSHGAFESSLERGQTLLTSSASGSKFVSEIVESGSDPGRKQWGRKLRNVCPPGVQRGMRGRKMVVWSGHRDGGTERDHVERSEDDDGT